MPKIVGRTEFRLLWSVCTVVCSTTIDSRSSVSVAEYKLKLIYPSFSKQKLYIRKKILYEKKIKFIFLMNQKTKRIDKKGQETFEWKEFVKIFDCLLYNKCKYVENNKLSYTMWRFFFKFFSFCFSKFTFESLRNEFLKIIFLTKLRFRIGKIPVNWSKKKFFRWQFTHFSYDTIQIPCHQDAQILVSYKLRSVPLSYNYLWREDCTVLFGGSNSNC